MLKHTWLFDSDLSSSVVLPVRHKYDEMVRIVVSLRESFEECAIQLHHYTPQDEIDKRTICLFANKSDPKELFAALHNLDEDLLIFGINVWFLNMNVMNSSRAYKKKYLVYKNYILNVPRFIDECWKDALIEKMIKSEKRASRPRRHFQSSFRLLEDKWKNPVGPI
ncbi:hypothetical protein Glove_151g125 [Diversispora epigaea]|uniref:Uncharacterized protein n=1 Tax=Diversispora epigaea TaxID=1348612 RepID=A0A397IXM1_9GLOM|nr:hypothetical protein Glove_151g125 [Diversispora epigaea]